MAIKSTLITTVNSFYTILVTIVKVKASLLEIINNFYGSIITESNITTGNVFSTKNALTGYTYYVKVCKQGRKVTLSGQVYNETESIIGDISNQYFFEITGAEYIPDTDSQYYALSNGIANNGTSVRIYLANNKLYTSALGDDAVSFNFEYLTKD